MAIDNAKKQELRKILMSISEPQEREEALLEYVCELEVRFDSVDEKIGIAIENALQKMRSEFRKGDELTFTSIDRLSSAIEKRLKPRMDSFDGRLETRRVRAEEDRNTIKDLVERVKNLESK